MTKPTPKQQRVLDMMAEGWELGLYGGLNPSAILQKRGIGKGGAVESVHLGTFVALRRHGKIQCKKQGSPVSIYEVKPSSLSAG